MVVELLLKNGAQLDFEEKNGYAPLSQAIERGNTDSVKLLLSQGVKVDFRYKIVSKSNQSTLD